MPTTTKKIYIIDDSAVFTFAIKKALEIKSYDVAVSGSFPGIDAMLKIAPDLIFLDVSLPGRDGRDIARELKSNSATKHIPVIMLTGYSGADEIVKEAGAEDYLLKPFGLVNLWEKTAKYLS